MGQIFPVCHVPSGHALIRYSNLGSAVYAKEKLNGFEYPPGNRLAVNFVDDGEDRSRYTHTNVCPYCTHGIHCLQKGHSLWRHGAQTPFDVNVSINLKN